MNKWQYLPHDLWFLKWKALGASSPSADFGRLRTSTEDFRLLPESSEMTVSSSKIPALPGWKSHAYISEKVGRYTLTLPWSADCTQREVKHEVNHVPQTMYLKHRDVTRHILILKKNLANYKILSSSPIFFFFFTMQIFFLQYKWAESCTANIEFSRISSAQTWHGQCIYIYKTVFAIFKKIAFIRNLLGLNTPLFNFHFWGFLKRLKFDLIVKKALRQNTSIKNSYVDWRNAVHCIAFFTISFRFHSFRRLPLDIKLKGKKLSFIL